jgi:hypothetical protein
MPTKTNTDECQRLGFDAHDVPGGVFSSDMPEGRTLAGGY